MCVPCLCQINVGLHVENLTAYAHDLKTLTVNYKNNQRRLPFIIWKDTPVQVNLLRAPSSFPPLSLFVQVVPVIFITHAHSACAQSCVLRFVYQV